LGGDFCHRISFLGVVSGMRLAQLPLANLDPAQFREERLQPETREAFLRPQKGE